MKLRKKLFFSTIYFPHSSFRRVNNGWLYSLCKLGCGFTLLKVTWSGPSRLQSLLKNIPWEGPISSTKCWAGLSFFSWKVIPFKDVVSNNAREWFRLIIVLPFWLAISCAIFGSKCYQAPGLAATISGHFFYFFKGKHKYTKRGGPYQTTCGCRGAVSSFPPSNFIFFIFKLYSCCVIPLVNQFHAALSVTSLCYLEKLLREIVCVVPI